MGFSVLTCELVGCTWYKQRSRREYLRTNRVAPQTDMQEQVRRWQLPVNITSPYRAAVSIQPFCFSFGSPEILHRHSSCHILFRRVRHGLLKTMGHSYLHNLVLCTQCQLAQQANLQDEVKLTIAVGLTYPRSSVELSNCLPGSQIRGCQGIPKPAPMLQRCLKQCLQHSDYLFLN